MTAAAKRARKKANKLKGWPEQEPAAEEITPQVNEPATTESEHAAAVTALAAARKMKKTGE
jgi:hypothetical protein